MLQERHALYFIKEDLCYKLANISEKLYRLNTPFTQLTSEEHELWNSFDIHDITFFLSGQRERVPDYSQYLCGCPSNRPGPQPAGPLPPFQHGQQPNLPSVMVNPPAPPPAPPGPPILQPYPFINPFPGPSGAHNPFIDQVPGPFGARRSPLNITARAA